MNFRARIYKSSKREFECKSLETGEIIQATALGKIQKKGGLVVGDYVEVTPLGEGFEIRQREERTSEIFRMLIREQKKKVTAANCDVLVILSSVSRPEFKRGIIDRFLLRAAQWGIPAIVVFNKMDEYEGQIDLQFESNRLKELGVECYEVSAKLGSSYQTQFLENSFDDLVHILKNKTAIFLGKSGVGKSHTITTLAGGEVDLKTKEVRKIGKGSHTTTWSEIVDCGDFELIDSPGIRSFSLEDVHATELLSLFPDLEERATNCKFNNCNHLPNAKGCHFWDESNFETEEQWDSVHSRLDSYHRFQDEIEEIPDWKKL